MFLSSYGSPSLQALMGFGPDAAGTLRHTDHDVLREANEARLRAELELQFEAGGLAEAIIRALIYIRLPENSIDERGYSVAKAVRDARPAGLRLSQPQLKALFCDQFLLLTMDSDRAVRALPNLLPADPATRRQALADIRRVLAASGRQSEEATRRLGEIDALFSAGGPAAEPNPSDGEQSSRRASAAALAVTPKVVHGKPVPEKKAKSDG